MFLSLGWWVLLGVAICSFRKTFECTLDLIIISLVAIQFVYHCRTEPGILRTRYWLYSLIILTLLSKSLVIR